MKLIRQKYNYHVSLDTVEELEEVILSDTSISFTNEIHKKISKTLFHILNLFIKQPTNKNRKINKSIKLNKENEKSSLFAVLMGPDFSKCLPFFLFSKNKSLFVFDSWPSNHKIIIKFLTIFKVNNIFLTSSQATKIIQQQVPNTNCHWVPEGILPTAYNSFEFKNKSIDVLALGRRFNSYHEQIVECLENNNKVYLYEKKRGQIIFPTRDGFIEGLAKSKISICVPSSITHPDRSGNIEIMTIRYLQSMVSKCLILGHAPKEMVTLFGYNPVIEIDEKNPGNQILAILNNYEHYHSLIEKNYKMVLKNHTWNNRWNLMKEILNKN